MGALAVCACAAPARAADPERDTYEAGVDTPAEVPREVSDARDELRDDLGSQGLLTVDETSGAVRFLAQLDGFLDDTPSSDPVGAARDYLAGQAEAFGVEGSDIAGLRVTGQQTGGETQSVEFTQSVDGVPIVDSSLEAHLDGEGRLLAITGGLVPDPQLESSEPDIPRSEAVEAATEGVGGDGYDGRLVAYSSGDELRLAWRVMVNASSTGHYDTLVDAETGEVVRRHNLVKFAGQALLFDNYPGADTGGTQSLGSLAPWLDPSPTRLSGPNVHAFADVEDEVPGSGASPLFTPPPGRETNPDVSGDFLFPYGDFVTTDYDCGLDYRCSWDPKTPNSWVPDGDQAATQLFYYVNRFHDHLADAPGIDFTGQLEGTDRVVAQAQDGADKQDVPGDTPGYPGALHANNANMTVLPRDSSAATPGALMQMYLWDPTRDADLDEVPNYRPVHGGDDPSLVFHEYAHALNNRLVTDAVGYGALNGPQAGAIDEGTADWFALDYLVGDGTTPYLPDDLSSPDVTLAGYAVEGPTGLRTQAIDCPVGANDPACPNAGGSAGAGGYTYGDFARIRGGAEVHDDGEIWAQTLWDLRRRLLLDYGSSDGLERVRRLVTNGLALSPPNPSFLDMRNAILLANEQAGTDGVPAAVIWQVFAQRGMGYAASTVDTDDVHPLQDFSAPPAPAAATGSVSGTVRDVNTGAAVAGALVAFAGHDSGLGEDLSTHTAANGTYRIDRVPARTWSFLTVARANGYDRATSPAVPIAAGRVTTRNVSLRRNWALASGGATIRSWTGPNFAGSGCGPGSTIDGTRRGVWSTYGTAPGSAMPGAKEQVIALPAPISLGEIRIDPSSGCGDSAGAALAGYVVQASANASTYTTVAQGTFGSSNVGRANPVTLIARPGGVRYLKLRALSTQGSSPYMDVAEVQVFSPLPATPPSPPPPQPPPPPPPPAKLTFLTKQAKLSRGRRFVWKVSGPKGALVRAQFTVRVKPSGRRARKITFAKASFRLSAATGRARVVVKVSKRTLRRVRSLRPRLGVVARAAGQRRTGTLSLRRPKPRRAGARTRPWGCRPRGRRPSCPPGAPRGTGPSRRGRRAGRRCCPGRTPARRPQPR